MADNLFDYFADIRAAKEKKREEKAQPVRADTSTAETAFAIWKQQPGARQVLRHCYRRAAYYYRSDYRRHRLPVSVKLIWEEVRQQIKRGRLRMAARGMELKKWQGYRLNNNFTADLARHILENRPQWTGLFELRERKEEENAN